VGRGRGDVAFTPALPQAPRLAVRGWWLCPSAAQSTHRNGWLCGERTPQHLLHVSALRTSGTPAKRAEQGGPAPQRRAGALGLRAAPRANSASERARARRRPAWTCTWRAA